MATVIERLSAELEVFLRKQLAVQIGDTGLDVFSGGRVPRLGRTVGIDGEAPGKQELILLEVARICLRILPQDAGPVLGLQWLHCSPSLFCADAVQQEPACDLIVLTPLWHSTGCPPIVIHHRGTSRVVQRAMIRRPAGPVPKPVTNRV